MCLSAEVGLSAAASDGPNCKATARTTRNILMRKADLKRTGPLGHILTEADPADPAPAFGYCGSPSGMGAR
jgi:hypothetical protein